MIFCTCFDSGYLDKGMVLYRSLERHCVDFTMYIYCFDHMTYKVLEKAGLARTVLVEWSRFETLELLEKKKERTRAEYYWTCTPQIIRHTLDCYRVDHCVYIDADMAFYSDPEVLLEEIKNAHGSIGIMEHRFNRGISGSRYRRRI